MTTLYLVRHGETLENSQHILQGHMPGNLTQRGIEQAEKLSDELATVRFDALVCSDLKRCIDTAEILNRPHSLKILTTTLLRERNWGALTGVAIPSIDRTKPFPPNVESEKAMSRRARIFLDFISNTYPGKTVLAVGHGLFCRQIQATFHDKPMREIQLMTNTEVRILLLP